MVFTTSLEIYAAAATVMAVASLWLLVHFVQRSGNSEGRTKPAAPPRLGSRYHIPSEIARTPDSPHHWVYDER